MTGFRFSGCEVLTQHPDRYVNGEVQWVCRCVCGAKFTAIGGFIRSGRARGCGCVKRAAARVAGLAFITHGHARGRTVTRTYASYRSMLQRCTDPNLHNYNNYGGRGIAICGRWLSSFENFLDDMGERPVGRTLDRIDNDGDYEGWTTYSYWATEAANRRPRRAALGVAVTASETEAPCPT